MGAHAHSTGVTRERLLQSTIQCYGRQEICWRFGKDVYFKKIFMKKE